MITFFKFYIVFIGILVSVSAHCQLKTQFLAENISLRGVKVVDSKNCWVSGSRGSIYKSEDSGNTWTNMCPQKFANQDFRGVFALNKKKIFAMAAGEAEKGSALIIKSIDAGKTWVVVFSTHEKGVFFDAIKFKNKKVGFVLGDPLNEKPYLLKTTNAGKTWTKLEADFPEMLKGEASFAASNSCLSIVKNTVFFNTQNRVFRSSNLGKTWEVFDTPFEAGPSLGIFGLHFWNKLEGIALGGDYVDKEKKNLQYSFTDDGGKTWQQVDQAQKVGLAESAFLTKKGMVKASLIGTQISDNHGIDWASLGETSFHAIDCSKNYCILAGGKGAIGILSLDK